MTFPFFDNGLTRGRVREAQAFQERDRATLERLRQQVDLDVRQALLDISEARQRITTSEKELISAREALRVAEVRYRSGVGTTVEVTDAQLAVSRAGQNLANSRFDLTSPNTKIEQSGKPGQRGWRVLILRRSMSPVTIDSRMVDPRTFMEALRQWRPDL